MSEKNGTKVSEGIENTNNAKRNEGTENMDNAKGNEGTENTDNAKGNEGTENTDKTKLNDKWKEVIGKNGAITSIKRKMAWLNWSPFTHFLRNNRCYGNYYYLWLKNTLTPFSETVEIAPIMRDLSYATNNFDAVRGIVKAVVQMDINELTTKPKEEQPKQNPLDSYELKELEKAYIAKRAAAEGIVDKYQDEVRKALGEIKIQSTKEEQPREETK